MNQKAKALICACQKSLRINEHNIRKIKGVPMSHSDVETAQLYAETILRNGTYEGELMRPRGAVQEVLVKFGLEVG